MHDFIIYCMLLFVFSTVVLDCDIATDLEALALMSEQIYRQVLTVIVNIIITEHLLIIWPSVLQHVGLNKKDGLHLCSLCVGRLVNPLRYVGSDRLSIHLEATAGDWRMFQCLRTSESKEKQKQILQCSNSSQWNVDVFKSITIQVKINEYIYIYIYNNYMYTFIKYINNVI